MTPAGVVIYRQTTLSVKPMLRTAVEGRTDLPVSTYAEASSATALQGQGMDEIDYVHLAFHQHTMQQAVQAI